MNQSYDVFLSHNSKDKPAVRELAEALRSRGLRVWLDERELVPGRRWQEALEEIIETTRSAAVLVGRDGLGPWQDAEMRGCLSELVSRKLPVIPVLLPDAPEAPKLPLFLKQFTWVDLRGGLTAEGVDRLQWGITAERRPDVLPPIPEEEDGRGTRGRGVRSVQRLARKIVAHRKPIAGAFAALAVLSAILYALWLRGEQRHEESEALVAGVEEQLIFKDVSSLSEADARALQSKIYQAFRKDRNSSRVWGVWGVFQAYEAFRNPALVKDTLDACAQSRRLDLQAALGDLCSGMARLGKGDWRSAEIHFQVALRKQPDLAIAWFYHGQALWELHRLVAAERALKKAHALSPQRTDFGLELAKFYLLNENTPGALQILRETTASSDTPAGRNALAIVLHGVGDLPAAIAELEPVANGPRASVEQLTNMACLLNESNEFDKALAFAIRALGASPNSRAALIEATDALVGLKRDTAALEYSRRLLPLARDYRWVRENHQFLQAKSSDPSTSGVYLNGPVTLALCQGWVLTRFSTEFQNAGFELTANGKYVFPPAKAGKPAPPSTGVTIPPGEHDVVISCGKPSTISPDWLGPVWQTSPPPAK